LSTSGAHTRWKLVLVVLFAIPVVTAIFFAPPAFLAVFIVASIISFLRGKSRAVTDPIYGLADRTKLSPRDFQEWAATVVSSSRYAKAFESFVNNPEVGFDRKLLLQGTQLKAIIHAHAPQHIFVALLLVGAFCVYDTIYGFTIFRAPLLTGFAVGVVWGYGLGIFRRWTECEG
jgi:hypothetical protein